MALTQEDVRGIADYARIALTDTEVDEMVAFMNDAVAMLDPILAYADEPVEPTFHPASGPVNVMAADAADAERSLPVDIALQNAASTRGRSFRVPSILGEGADC